MLRARHCLLYTKLVLSLSKKIYKDTTFGLFCSFPFWSEPWAQGLWWFLLYGISSGRNKRLLCYFILSFKPLYFWVFPLLLIACISSSNILLPTLFLIIRAAKVKLPRWFCFLEVFKSPTERSLKLSSFPLLLLGKTWSMTKQ